MMRGSVKKVWRNLFAARKCGIERSIWESLRILGKPLYLRRRRRNRRRGKGRRSVEETICGQECRKTERSI